MNELLVQLQRDIAVNSIEKGFYKDYMKVWSQLQTICALFFLTLSISASSTSSIFTFKYVNKVSFPLSRSSRKLTSFSKAANYKLFVIVP